MDAWLRSSWVARGECETEGAYRYLAQARVGALAARERSTLRALLWLGRTCPVEFRLHFDTSEFLRQELREEHSHFTRRLCSARRCPEVHSAPKTSTFLLLSMPVRVGDIRPYLAGINL